MFTPLQLELGAVLEGFGGVLRCETCHFTVPLRNVAAKLRDGWPRCCGTTMRWWTQRQLDSGEMPDAIRGSRR